MENESHTSHIEGIIAYPQRVVNNMVMYRHGLSTISSQTSVPKSEKSYQCTDFGRYSFIIHRFRQGAPAPNPPAHRRKRTLRAAHGVADALGLCYNVLNENEPARRVPPDFKQMNGVDPSMPSKPVLLIMAAGMGSRYGGLKQVDPVGPYGELIIHYSIYDALRAGFDRIVFVIRRSIEEAFRERVGRLVEAQAAVTYVFQELDDLPGGAPPPAIHFV